MGAVAVVAAGSGYRFAVNLIVGLTGLFTVALPVAAGARQVWRAWRSPPISGADGLIDRLVKVRAAEGLHGRVVLDGAFWAVRSAAAPLAVGQLVRVRAVDGLELVVEPVGWLGSTADVVGVLRGKWRSA